MKLFCLKLSLTTLLFLSLNFSWAVGGGCRETEDTQTKVLSQQRLGYGWPLELYNQSFQFFKENKLNELKKLRLVSKEFNDAVRASLSWRKIALDLRPEGRLDDHLKLLNDSHSKSSNHLIDVQFQMPFSLSGDQMERFNTLFPKDRYIKMFVSKSNYEFYVDNHLMEHLCQHHISFNEHILFGSYFFKCSNFFEDARYAYNVLKSPEKFKYIYSFDRIDPVNYFESDHYENYAYHLDYFELMTALSFDEICDLFKIYSIHVTNDNIDEIKCLIKHQAEAEIVFDIKSEPEKTEIVESKKICRYDSKLKGLNQISHQLNRERMN